MAVYPHVATPSDIWCSIRLWEENQHALLKANLSTESPRYVKQLNMEGSPWIWNAEELSSNGGSATYSVVTLALGGLNSTIMSQCLVPSMMPGSCTVSATTLIPFPGNPQSILLPETPWRPQIQAFSCLRLK